MATAFVPRPDEHGPGGAPDGRGGDWDFAADDMVALADLLARDREPKGERWTR